MKQLLIFSLLLLSTFFAWSQTPNQAAPKAPPETIAAIRPIEDSLMVILDSLAEQSSRDTLGTPSLGLFAEAHGLNFGGC